MIRIPALGLQSVSARDGAVPFLKFGPKWRTYIHILRQYNSHLTASHICRIVCARPCIILLGETVRKCNYNKKKSLFRNLLDSKPTLRMDMVCHVGTTDCSLYASLENHPGTECWWWGSSALTTTHPVWNTMCALQNHPQALSWTAATACRKNKQHIIILPLTKLQRTSGLHVAGTAIIVHGNKPAKCLYHTLPVQRGNGATPLYLKRSAQKAWATKCL